MKYVEESKTFMDLTVFSFQFIVSSEKNPVDICFSFWFPFVIVIQLASRPVL